MCKVCLEVVRGEKKRWQGSVLNASGANTTTDPASEPSDTWAFGYRRLRPREMVYYVANVDDVPRVEQEGLRADGDGLIDAILDVVAAESRGLLKDRYALLWIDRKGIADEPVAVDEAEFGLYRPLLCIIEQNVIEPRFVHYLATVSSATGGLCRLWDLIRTSSGGLHQQSERHKRVLLEAAKSMRDARS